MEGWNRSSLLHPEIQRVCWALIAAVIIVAVCYANSIPNDFILDDYPIVAVNPSIRTIEPAKLFGAPYWGQNSQSGIYRPLTIFSFSLEYPLWRRWPGGYRLTNLLLHAINGLLVFLIARGLLPSVRGAFAASALYLAHPVHTEPVVGLAGRSELLAALFFLLAWVFFRRGKIVLCSVAFFLSLLSKENAITFPLVMALDHIVSNGGLRKLLPQWKRFATVAAVGMVYLALRVWVLGGLGVPQAAQYLEGGMTFLQRELTTGRAFLKYFQLLIAPVNVTGDYDFNSIPVASANDWIAWAGLLIVAAMIVAGVRLVKTNPAAGFAILFFFVTLLPNSNWIFPTSIIMSERALYLPSLAVCLLAGLLWAALPTLEQRNIVAGGVLAVAVALCVSHNYVWRNDLTYYANMVRVFPDNIRGRQGYGVALVETGQPELAREQFEAGLKIRRSVPLLVGLGQTYMMLDGECVRARPVLNEALLIQPADPFARWLTGGCYEREGRIEEAEAAYRQAVSMTEFPDPKLLVDWGRLLKKNGRVEEANEAFSRAALLLK